MRIEVEKFIALGPLPSEEKADESFELFGPAFDAITPPISDEEARSLISCFGPDGAFGLAWSLLHLIETSPGWPLWDCLISSTDEWIARLHDRAVRGGYTPPNPLLQFNKPPSDS